MQPKKYKLKQESLVSRKFKQEFHVSIKLKQAKRESSDSSIEKKSPEYFEFLVYLLAGYKIETIVTLNYGGKIMTNIIFFHKSSIKIAYINIILLIVLGEN